MKIKANEMKCDLCGEEMRRYDYNGRRAKSCEQRHYYRLVEIVDLYSPEPGVISNISPLNIIYNDIEYTPEEFARLLKLKAFL